MKFWEAIKAIAENPRLEVRWCDYVKQIDDVRLWHFFAEPRNRLVDDTAAFDVLAADWKLYDRDTGDEYVPTTTTQQATTSESRTAAVIAQSQHVLPILDMSTCPPLPGGLTLVCRSTRPQRFQIWEGAFLVAERLLPTKKWWVTHRDSGTVEEATRVVEDWIQSQTSRYLEEARDIAARFVKMRETCSASVEDIILPKGWSCETREHDGTLYVWKTGHYAVTVPTSEEEIQVFTVLIAEARRRGVK